MASFQERLLSVMDKKNHWGWEQLTGPHLSKKQLLIHFQQEYEVYVRDFPIFLARILGRLDSHSTFNSLKRELAENIFEEQTGGLSLSVSKGFSHPDLFLKMMRGLGFSEKVFQSIRLLPTSLAYRSYLDLLTFQKDWRVAAAVLTLFVEGSVEDRARLKKNYKPTKSLDQKLKSHSLHKYHGLRISDMDLVRAHHMIEGDHRRSAWETLLKLIPKNLEDETVEALTRSLELWQLFRDGVCVEMQMHNPEWAAYRP
ncbi:MAG: iron-containing redox enzyme family protein [Deltaproteobacteria bacterium]|nr:iron-containing redox enzyme family protein [Deltaproteobacteria bacterium]